MKLNLMTFYYALRGIAFASTTFYLFWLVKIEKYKKNIKKICIEINLFTRLNHFKWPAVTRQVIITFKWWTTYSHCNKRVYEAYF